jgi:hypothetical protein
VLGLLWLLGFIGNCESSNSLPRQSTQFHSSGIPAASSSSPPVPFEVLETQPVYKNNRPSASAVRMDVLPLGQQPFAISAGLGFGIPTGDRTRDLGEGRVTLAAFFTASTWLGRFNAPLNGGWHPGQSTGGLEWLRDLCLDFFRRLW